MILVLHAALAIAAMALGMDPQWRLAIAAPNAPTDPHRRLAMAALASLWMACLATPTSRTDAWRLPLLTSLRTLFLRILPLFSFVRKATARCFVIRGHLPLRLFHWPTDEEVFWLEALFAATSEVNSNTIARISSDVPSGAV